MLVIDMGVDPEQSFQNRLHDCLEVGRKFDTNFARK